MTLAILATGDEIIHGDTLNTNGHYIAKALSSDGIPLGLQVTCSDKEHDLADAISFLAQKHSVIVSIGGLGPTSDDRTRFAFARYFGLELVEYAEALDHIQARIKRANLPFDDGNRLQALFPPNATILPNPNGTAQGCLFSVKAPQVPRYPTSNNVFKIPSSALRTPSPHVWGEGEIEGSYWEDKLIVLLPGPPRECLPMFNDYVLPYLQNTQHSQKKLLSWQLFGVAEGQVAAILETALNGISCSFGYRLDTPYLEFKVRCASETVAEVQTIVDPLVASMIISPPKQKASTLLRDRLTLMKEPIFILDRATGGVLETLLRCPDNIEQVNFHDRSTTGTGLYFEITGLDVFWRQDKEATSADLLMTYSVNGSMGQYSEPPAFAKTTGFERHSIPYRGHSMVLHYAAEWLSFRILHVIDQIH